VSARAPRLAIVRRVTPDDEARLAELAALAEVRTPAGDPAHDFLHARRVATNARRIALGEHADPLVVVPAALLHELFNYPKDHPESHRSGEVCAERAAALLETHGWPDAARRADIALAIRVHGYSGGVVPEALEARVLQDADRLDAIGAIGVARCFATCASMRRPFYSPDDPFCRTREPDDKRFGVDHFYRKLLRLADALHTPTARAMAARRARFLGTYLAELESELA
jgi:uncharacterized protein